MNFHGRTSIPLGWLQIHIIGKKFKKNKKIEVKMFQFALNRDIHKATPFWALFNPPTHLSIFKHCFLQSNENLLHTIVPWPFQHMSIE
jgi:hypothetical protein